MMRKSWRELDLGWYFERSKLNFTELDPWQ